MAWKRVYHHGIYIDDDCVIEVVVAGINKCTYAEFKDGCPVYKIRYGVRPKAFYRFMGLQVDQVLERKYNRQETAARAIAFASSRHRWEYHLLLNNCEHFATWVVMGTSIPYNLLGGFHTSGLMSGSELWSNEERKS